MFFFFPPQLSLNPSGVRSIIAGEAIEARTHIAPRLTLRGRRGCSAAVIQWAAHPHPPTTTLHGAQHLCLSGTFAPDKQGRPFTEAPTSRIRAPGITEVYLAQKTLLSAVFTLRRASLQR